MIKGNIPEEILSAKYIKLIIKAINDSKKQYKEYARLARLATSNGKYIGRWDYIFTNIRDAFLEDSFEPVTISRGPLWEFIAIYQKDMKLLYLVLREDRFREIKNDASSPYHYVRVLNSQNYHLQEEKSQQIAFFPDIQIPSYEYINEDIDRMIGEIKDDVEGCVNILFDENENGLNKITANIATYSLDIIKTYNWNKYISADIEEITDTQADDATNTPPLIELNIRANKRKDNKEEIIDDKSSKEKKLKEE